MLRDFKAGGKNLILGLRIKGTPASSFDKAPERNFLKQRPEAHLSKAVHPVNIILIADSDLLADRMWVEKSGTLGVRQLYPFAGNADLIVNALDNLSGAASLIDLRSKAEWRRPFTVIENLALKAEKQYREQETRLYYELQATRERLRELTKRASSDGRDLLSREDKEELKSLQKRQLELRSALRNVQTVLVKDVADLQTDIILINVLSVPALLIIVALFVAKRRRAGRNRLR